MNNLSENQINLAVYLPKNKIEISESKENLIFIGKSIIGTFSSDIIDNVLVLHLQIEDRTQANMLNLVGIGNMYAILVYFDKMELISFSNLRYELPRLKREKQPYYLFNEKENPNGFLCFSED